MLKTLTLVPVGWPQQAAKNTAASYHFGFTRFPSTQNHGVLGHRNFAPWCHPLQGTLWKGCWLGQGLMFMHKASKVRDFMCTAGP